MAGLNRSSILVVDDHEEIRKILISILRDLGCENVLGAESASEAIEILTTVKKHPAKIGVYEIDAVVSDWVMRDLDGAALLRWIRRHHNSPNRFMPFLMLSAYSDEERVQKSRDLGANGFMAKPFTTETLATYLLDAMRDERHYVWLSDYFGPDRRRRIEDVPEELRQSEVPYREKGVRYFPSPKTIRERIGKGFEFDAEAIEEAQHALEQWSEDFADWTRIHVEKLDQALAKCAQLNVRGRRDVLSEINHHAHELRGLGGTFGFPLVTSVSMSLFDLTLGKVTPTDECLSLVRTHIDTLRAIIRENVRGEGGPVGQELVQELNVLNKDFRRQLQ